MCPHDLHAAQHAPRFEQGRLSFGQAGVELMQLCLRSECQHLIVVLVGQCSAQGVTSDEVHSTGEARIALNGMRVQRLLQRCL